MSVSLLVDLLPYWNLTNIGISQVPDEISFWFILQTFLGCWYTSYILFGILVCLSLLVGLFPYWNKTNIGISPVVDKISFWIFLETFPGYFWIIYKSFQISWISVSLLVGLLKLGLHRYNSISGWDIFLKFSGRFPGVFVYYIQIILNFLYGRHSVSWLTSLLKLCQYRDICSCG